MTSLIEYLPIIGIGTGLGIGALLFLKFRKKPEKPHLLTREKEFKEGEGPQIAYDVGLGGSPYDGHIVKLEENGEKANIVLLDKDGTEVKLINLNTTETGNLKMVSSPRELLHSQIKFVCNKDAVGELRVLPDGSNWTIKGKTESQVIVDTLAEARAYAKAVDDIDDIIQYKSLRRKSRSYASAPSETGESEEVDVSKFG